MHIVEKKARPYIAILMATYNGEKYLREQIESIQRQTFSDWQLFISDDESTDSTFEIARSMAENDSRIHVGKNTGRHGARNNFMTLLTRVEATYYMFCDQDDVWLPRKIELTLGRMLQTEKETGSLPIVIHTDLTVVDEVLRPTAPSFWALSRIRPELLRTFTSQGGHFLATGCTMMLNSAARNVSLPIAQEALMHDVWVTLRVLHAGGKVNEVAEPTILYRQHGGNTIGAQDTQHHYIRRRASRIGEVLRSNRATYAMLHAAGYGSIWRYFYEKIRYFLAYRHADHRS